MQVVSLPRVAVLLLGALFIHGCGQLPERPDRPLTDPAAQRAEALRQQGDALGAAELYQELASRATDVDLQVRYLLAAGEAASDGGDWDLAREVVDALAGRELTRDGRLRFRLLNAEALMQGMRPLEALEAIGGYPDAGTRPELQIRYYRDLAGIYRQMGNLFETANALQALDGLLPTPDERLSNQVDILRTLTLLGEGSLEALQPTPPDSNAGWISLALLVKRHSNDPNELAPRLDAWRERYPGHPAMPQLLTDYAARLRDQLVSVGRIAVLLPQSGRLANVAAAVRDGMMVSLLTADPGQRPTLRFYDSTDPAAAWPLYNQAVADGAELVIGPLQKQAVEQLVRAGELPTPTLVLNEVALTTAPPRNLYMFALSPEDEARQVAEKAWVDGIRRPAVLVPQGDWGGRLAGAFADRWRELGGDLPGTGRYDPEAHDFSDPIRALLHLDQSAERHAQMQRWLGRQLEFEPRRRDDVDAVFIAARPTQAQGMRPQLQFHHAGDLPVYATSHAWVGRLSSNQAADMRGILLPEIPWLIEPGDDPVGRDHVAALLPKSAAGFGRLYAMGMDALRLAPHLQRLAVSRYESLDGATGNLHMDEYRRVRRQLVWVRLDEQPEILGYAPRLDLQGPDVEVAPVEPEAAEAQPAS
jgi:outer membrane PBP1 activator LpoA protein